MCIEKKSVLIAIFGLICTFGMGCGGSDHPPLGYVTGKVTMNGEPMAGVIVRFNPETGRPSTALADRSGKYDLTYTYGVKGAKAGPNVVSFEWPTGVDGPPIPENYAGKSDLKVDVKKGTNSFDFDLKIDTAQKAAGRAVD